MRATCSQAVSELDRTSLPGNTFATFMPGSRVRGSTVRPTVHIQCAGRRRRRFIKGRFSFCSDIRNSKARSGILGSRSKTLSDLRAGRTLMDLGGPATWRAADTDVIYAQ